jgi:hypothetical protein
MYRARTDRWYLERVIWLLAGTFALGSALLAWLHSPYWLILTGLVGVNLIIFALTGFCIMANILYALGIRPLCEDLRPVAGNQSKCKCL